MVVSIKDKKRWDISRKQFEELDREWTQKIADTLVEDTTKVYAVDTEHVHLTRDDLGSILEREEIEDWMKSVSREDIDTYIECICRHINESGGRCEMLKSELFFKLRKSTYKQVADEIDEALNVGRCQGDNLKGLDYLLIPHHDEFDHWILGGFAPRQNFVFLLDSLEDKFHPQKFPLKALQALGVAQFKLEKDLPLFGLWAARSRGAKEKPHPNGVRQGDMYNCGVFTSTNTMCLAFGYPMTCYQQRDLNPLKRPRMAAELLNGGFDAPFNYKNIKIPTEWTKTFEDDLGERRVGDPCLVPEDDAGIDKAGPATTGPVKEGAWPEQFDPRYFQRMDLLYAVKEPLFADVRGKKALGKECRRLGIKGWSSWSRENEELFRRWMENYMAGEKAKSRESEPRKTEFEEKKDHARKGYSAKKMKPPKTLGSKKAVPTKIGGVKKSNPRRSARVREQR